MNRSLVVGLAAGAAVLIVGCTQQERTFAFAENGVATCEIVRPSEAVFLPDVQFFTNAVKRVTGADVPIVERRTSRRRAVSFTFVTRDLAHEDAYRVTFPDAKTLAVEGTRHSCRWALNALLEKDFGVCFCFNGPHGTHYPSRPTVTRPAAAFAGDAAFKYHRELYCEDWAWERALSAKAPEGNFFAHNLCTLFPVAKYAKEPWKSKLMPFIRGKRIDPPAPDWGWQPCLSNPEVLAEAKKNVLAFFAQHPERQVYSLGMNDNQGFCTCDGCEAMNGGSVTNKCRSGHGELDSFSIAYFKWVNEIARAVRAKYPDRLIGVMAYNSVFDPPPFRLEDNVFVVLTGEIYQTLEPKIRERRHAWMLAWQEKCRAFGLYGYEYGARTYYVPRVYTRLIDDYFTAKNRDLPALNGFFAESHPCVGEGPKRWLLVKRAFDTTTPLDELLKTWYEACCGKEAAPYLKAYYDLWEDFWTGAAVRETPWYKLSMTGESGYAYLNDKTYLYAVTPELLAKGTALMSNVVAKATASGDADQKIRAERLRDFNDFYVARSLAAGVGFAAGAKGIRTPEEALDFLAVYPRLVREGARAQECVKKVVAPMVSERWFGCYAGERFDSLYLAKRLPAETAENPNLATWTAQASRFADDPRARAAMLKTGAPVFRAVLSGDALAASENYLWVKKLDEAKEAALWGDRPDFGLKIARLERVGDKRQFVLTARKGWQAISKYLRDFPRGAYCQFRATIANPFDQEITLELVADAYGRETIRIPAKTTGTCKLIFRAPSHPEAVVRLYLVTGGIPVGKSVTVTDMGIYKAE